MESIENYCHSCGHNPCDKGCRPARYRCDFDINANPYDPSIWNVTINGATTRVKVPKIAETDTKLSTSYTAGTLIYNAEKHADTITGAQLGSLINLEDLRDTDTANANSCDLLVYHPHCSECGDRCSAKDAKWENYHIPNDESNVLEPDEDGYYHVLSMTDCGCIEAGKIAKPSSDEEVLCILNNLLKTIKPFKGEGQFIDVETGGSTVGFEGGLNPNTGEFYVNWKDWYLDTQAAHGTVTGRLTTTSSFDYLTGKVTYTITSIYYDTITYTVDSDAAAGRPDMTTTIWGCFPGTYSLSDSHETLTNEGLKIFERTVHVALGNSYTQHIGVTYTGNFSVELDPNGGVSNWIDVMRLYNDWDIGDDDGIVEVRYINPLDWETC